MKTDTFSLLLQSAAEMRAIRRGERKPARIRRLEVNSPQVVRARLGLSQPQFAGLLGISVATLRNWEQGRRRPHGAAEILLRIAAKHPTIVQEAVSA
jgi:putative transcriptional regulator